MTWSQLKTLLNSAKVRHDGRENYSFSRDTSVSMHAENLTSQEE